MLFYFALSQLDESKMLDSLLKAWGVVKYEYGEWEIANFDTLPVSDSIPTPKGEWKILDGYKPIHLKGRWEYHDRGWRTRLFMPEMGSDLYDYPSDLLDWGRYLVFYIRGKGRYRIGSLFIYKNVCKGARIGVFDLDSSWIEVKLDLDSVPGKYNIHEIPDWMWDPLNHISVECYYYKKSKFYPLSMSIIPLADTFGTYEYEIELSPVYLVR